MAQSGAFTKSQPAFPEVERAAETGKMVFELEKKGAVTKDVVKLYTGYAVVTLDERLGIDEKEWKEKRRDSIERMRKGKQRDALVAYVQRLRKERAKDLKVNVRLKTAEEEAEAKKPANAK